MRANRTRGIKIVDLSTIGETELRDRRVLRYEGGVLMDVTGRRASVDLDRVATAGTLEDVTGMDPKAVMALLREGTGTIHDATNENPDVVRALAARSGGIIEVASLLRSDGQERMRGTLMDISGMGPIKIGQF